jgi:hypothetical protein
MCAATDPRAREEYHGAHPKGPTKSKLKQMREKQSAAVMGLMDMGAKAKESAAAKPAAPPERNSDLARYNESKTNPAAGVLTNPDLLRMIGSFIPTKSQSRDIKAKENQQNNKKYGIRGNLKREILKFFTPIFSTPAYKIDAETASSDPYEGKIRIFQLNPRFGDVSYKDVLDDLDEIIKQKRKYSINNRLADLLFASNDGDKILRLIIPEYSKEERAAIRPRDQDDKISVDIPIPKFKDDKFQRYRF